MKKVFKKVTALVAATIVISSVSAIGAGAVVLEKTFVKENYYLTSTQTFSYDSDTTTTYATNLTKCKLNGYSGILSCAELNNGRNTTYSNATNYQPSADKGSFLKVKAKKNKSYEGMYAKYWSYVCDPSGNTKGEIEVTRKLEF